MVVVQTGQITFPQPNGILASGCVGFVRQRVMEVIHLHLATTESLRTASHCYSFAVPQMCCCAKWLLAMEPSSETYWSFMELYGAFLTTRCALPTLWSHVIVFEWRVPLCWHNPNPKPSLRRTSTTSTHRNTYTVATVAYTYHLSRSHHSLCHGTNQGLPGTGSGKWCMWLHVCFLS